MVALRYRMVLFATCGVLVIGRSPDVIAQTSLPPVTVDAPAKKKDPAVRSSSQGRAARRVATSRSRRDPQRATTSPAPSSTGNQGIHGTDVGYVASEGGAATKTSTSLRETPQSVSVVTREQMDAQNVQSVGQALRYTAGSIADTRGPVSRYDVIYLRGFGGFDLEHLDGLKLPTGGNYAIPQVDPYMLERIEVLRGPSSVLYGQNQPGGIIDLVSKRPTAIPFGEAQLQVGNFNRIQGAFDIGGPVDKAGEWLYRLTGLARTSDTQVDFTKEQRISISPAVTWRPDNDTTLTILTNYQQDPSAGYFGFVPAQGSFLPNPNGKISTSFYDGDPSFDYFDRKQGTVGYLFEHRFDTWTVRQNLRYQAIDVGWGRVASRGLQADLQTLNRRVTTDDETMRSFAIDNQAEARFNTWRLQHTMLFGVDYQYSMDKFVLGNNNNAPTLNILNPVYYRTILPPPVIQSTAQSLSQVGIYAQDQIRLGNWALTLSGRHDWSEINTTDRLLNVTTDQMDHAWTERAGLVYLFDNGLAPYVSYSTSFQPTLGTGFGGATFVPTTGEQYEVGAKYKLPGYNAFVTVAAFDLTQQNVLTADPNPLHVCAGAACSIQTGEVRSRGVEFEGKASLTEGLSLLASYTHLDPVVTQSTTNNLGKRPIAIPTDTASMWADYTFHGGQLDGFGLGGGVRYVSSTAGDAANLYIVPAFTLFDAAIHYDLAGLSPQLKGYSFAVNAMNLFDKEYVSSCTSAPASCYYGSRRTVIGTLKYKW
jgi:iron complex outermembrane recepter protein